MTGFSSRRLGYSIAGVLAVLALADCTARDTMKQSAATPAATVVAKDAVYAPSEMAMRRLSGDQYQNIIADVFGPTIELGGRFEPDLRVGGLLAVGQSDVSITPSGMEQYDIMARHIAAQVIEPKH